MDNTSNKTTLKYLNQITRKSEYYRKLSQNRYSRVKGYIEIDDVIFNYIARTLVVYDFYDHSVFEEDFAHRTAAIVLKNLYNQQFGCYCLGAELFEAFNKTTPPTTLAEFKRVIPQGILLVPPKIKNPDGQLLKWIGFYHRLRNEEIAPMVFNKCNLLCMSDPIDSLYWFTVMDDHTQYGITRHLKIDENYQFNFSTDNVHISNDVEERGKNIETKSELEFTSKVSELLVQTLLYLQSEQNTETVMANKNQRTNHLRDKNNKLSPIIIGKNYRIKREFNGTSSDNSNSKKIFWRKGHWRAQRVGKREEKQSKMLWIQPVLVNSN